VGSAALKAHAKKMHGNAMASSGVFSCGKCPFLSVNRALFEAHSRSHGEEKKSTEETSIGSGRRKQRLKFKEED